MGAYNGLTTALADEVIIAPTLDNQEMTFVRGDAAKFAHAR